MGNATHTMCTLNICDCTRNAHTHTHLKITSSIEQKITRFEISMQHISRVNVLESSHDLVEKVANMIVA